MTKTQNIIALLIAKDYVQKPETFNKILYILMKNNLFALMGDDWSIQDVNEKKPHMQRVLSDLAFLVSGEQIESRHAKKILEDAWDCSCNDWDICWYLGDTKMLEEADGDGLAGMVAKVIEANPKAKADIDGGKKQAIGFLVGQVMKEAKGKANPNQIKKEIEKYQ